MKTKLTHFFSPIFSFGWLLYAVFLLAVWFYPIRTELLGFSAPLEIIVNFLCDVVWLPIGLFLPLYFSLAFAGVVNWHIAKVVIYLFGIAVAITGLLFLPSYFRYLIYLIVPFFAFLIYHLVQKKRIALHVYIFALVLSILVFHYGRTLLPSFRIGKPAQTLSLLTYNIGVKHEDNQRQLVAQIIEKENPDLVFIQEITSGDRKTLRNLLLEEYPYQFWADRFENYNGGVIFSRIPFTYTDNINIKNSVTKGHTNMNHVTINWKGRNIHLFNVHLTHGAAPFIQFLIGMKTLDDFRSETGRMYRRHNDEARDIINRVMSVEGPIVLSGDMNDTPNSFVYRLFSKYLDNAFASAGWGLGTTFGYGTLENNLPPKLRRFLFDFLRIDHVFTSTDFRVESIKVLPESASDHRPVLVHLSLK